MRASVFAVFAFILLFSGAARAAGQEDFSGGWLWEQGQESLELTLNQQGDKITGTHAAIGQGGLKADDGLAAETPTLDGTVQGNVATITFHTAYPDSDGHGTVTMTRHGDAIDWVITSSNGEHYLPKKATLHRAHKS